MHEKPIDKALEVFELFMTPDPIRIIRYNEEESNWFKAIFHDKTYDFLDTGEHKTDKDIKRYVKQMRVYEEKYNGGRK